MAHSYQDILQLAETGNPPAKHLVHKTDAQWQDLLSPEVYHITREHGTEKPSAERCQMFVEGLYGCACCGNLLFDTSEKFDSGTGWPSFTTPLDAAAIAYHMDYTYADRTRVEVRCNDCQAHLGHVFSDGPPPSGLRYCINALAIKRLELATFGGGCFWCTEGMFRILPGVHQVMSGYSAGLGDAPSYEQVCSGTTGHAEVVQISFDPEQISYTDLLIRHFASHDPTTLNQQGADIGTQYRSIILAHNAEQRHVAQATIAALQPEFSVVITTTIEDFAVFYPAEDYHQDYYRKNPDQAYCQAVIGPKIAKFRARFTEQN